MLVPKVYSVIPTGSPHHGRLVHHNMTVGDQTAEAVALFEKFVLANSCHSILSIFQQLCDCLDIHPLDEGWFYQSLKGT